MKNQLKPLKKDIANDLLDEKVIQRSEELMRFQQYRPYMLNEKLQMLAKILLRLIIVFRPNDNILTFDLLVNALDICAPELYFGILESDDDIQSDSAKTALKFSIIAQLLTAAVLSTQRMPICWNRRTQKVDVKGLVGSFPTEMLELE